MTSPNIPRTSPSPPTAKPFVLPMMTVFSVTNHPNKSVAHALDFDLVAVAATQADAIAKLRVAVKHHVEFGLKNDIDKCILFPAPAEYWDLLTPHTNLIIGEPIEIENVKMATALRTITDETELCTETA
jgi:hypothetical protein